MASSASYAIPTQQENALMKETKGKPKKAQTPKANASQPSLKAIQGGPAKPKK